MTFFVPTWLVYLVLYLFFGVIITVSGALFFALTYKITRAGNIYHAWYCYLRVRFYRKDANAAVFSFIKDECRSIRERNPEYAVDLARTILGAGWFDTIIIENPTEKIPRLPDGSLWLSPEATEQRRRLALTEAMEARLPELGKPDRVELCAGDMERHVDGHLFRLHQRPRPDGSIERWWELIVDNPSCQFFSASWIVGTSFTPASTPL